MVAVGLVLFASLASASALVMPPAPVAAVRCAAPMMQFGWGGGGNARDADLERRQGKLAARQQKAKEIPKGSVEVTFPQKGNKMVVAKQGEPLGKVIQRAGLRVKFDCKVRTAAFQSKCDTAAWLHTCDTATMR